MKAAVYFGPRQVRCQEVQDAALSQDHAMLVKVRMTSICGSDLHIYRGTLDGIMERGHSRLGHELSGEVVEVGRKVGRFRPGDRVTMAYSASCGECAMCRVGMTAHCLVTNKAVYGFGTAFGGLNGTQAEYLEIPYADAHALKVDDALSDEDALTLSCNLPTAVIASRLLQLEPGQTVAVVGLGPRGLLTVELLLQQGVEVGGSTQWPIGAASPSIPSESSRLLLRKRQAWCGLSPEESWPTGWWRWWAVPKASAWRCSWRVQGRWWRL